MEEMNGDSYCAGLPLLVQVPFMFMLFGFSYTCLLTSIIFALKIINDIALLRGGFLRIPVSVVRYYTV